MRATLDGNPLGATNLDDYKNVWRDAAGNAMVELSDEAQRAGKTKAKEAIDHAISKLYSDPAVIQQFNDRIAGLPHAASSGRLRRHETQSLHLLGRRRPQ